MTTQSKKPGENIEESVKDKNKNHLHSSSGVTTKKQAIDRAGNTPKKPKGGSGKK
jgi:hypothetical protein